MNDRPAQPGSRWKTLAAFVAVAIIVIFAHWPALQAQALSIDDHQFFATNPLVQNPSMESAWRFISEVRQPSTVQGYYQPLTMLSLMLDWAMGARPDDQMIAHITSLSLHALTILCVMGLLLLLFKNVWAAAFAALLYGVHPLTVELVVWLGQRKAVLAGLFSALCLLTYVAWVQRRAAAWYALSLVALTLALLSKPSALPVPMLLVALDYWPLRRLSRRAIVEKLPHFGVALLAGIISVLSHAPTVGFVANIGLGISQKLWLACSKIAFFLSKIVWPADLTVYYATPDPLRLSNPIVLAGVLMTALLLTAMIASLRRSRAFFTGVAFFLIGLSPVLGFIGFSEVFAFDNYAYIPLIGLTLPLAAGLHALWHAGEQRLWRRGAALTAVAILAAACTLRSREYIGAWTDTETHYLHLIEHAPGVPILFLNLGNHYRTSGQYTKALATYNKGVDLHRYIPAEVGVGWLPELFLSLGNLMRDFNEPDRAAEYFQAALEKRPDHSAAHRNLAMILFERGRMEAAIPHFEAVLLTRPNETVILDRLGQARFTIGRFDGAIDAWRRQLEIDPSNAIVHGNLALALGASGRFLEAERHARQAISLQPEQSLHQFRLGLVFANQARFEEAATCYEQAVALDPMNTDAIENLAFVRLNQRRPEEAIPLLERIVSITGGSARSRILLGEAFRMQGNAAAAIESYRAAVQIEPSSPDAHFALGMALRELGRIDEARKSLEEALRLNPQHPGAFRALNELR